MRESYNFDYDKLEIKISMDEYAKEIGDPIFRFFATYSGLKEITSDDEEEYFDSEEVELMTLVGHMSDFENDYSYSADAIAEDTIMNYFFARKMYSDVSDSEFENKLFEYTDSFISKWISIETVYLEDEIKDSHEEFQFLIFENCLKSLVKNWKILFQNDITMVVFSKKLYVSLDETVQKKLNSMYNRVGFYNYESSKELGNQKVNEEISLSISDLFSMDGDNRLFSSGAKDLNKKYYVGYI
ncbi:hypothetical protein BG261_06435 [Floricoccus tropicus]|uniref:Uncharacterized protein n=1 Tax=Floricoccus tropicus TaxID=1859473 RepID=A0A1E8GJV9_9LACT|nr:hypothetical protein [Floricoccus tropicus]OFI48530.1 hypothetical protein BG261_06435 [Floricoccus tropicus]